MLLSQFQYLHKLTALFNTLYNSNIIRIQILNQALIRIKRKLSNLNHRLIFRIQQLIKNRWSCSKHELMAIDIHFTLIPKILFSLKPERNITEIRLNEIFGQIIRECVWVALNNANVVNSTWADFDYSSMHERLDEFRDEWDALSLFFEFFLRDGVG